MFNFSIPTCQEAKKYQKTKKSHENQTPNQHQKVPETKPNYAQVSCMRFTRTGRLGSVFGTSRFGFGQY